MKSCCFIASICFIVVSAQSADHHSEDWTKWIEIAAERKIKIIDRSEESVANIISKHIKSQNIFPYISITRSLSERTVRLEVGEYNVINFLELVARDIDCHFYIDRNGLIFSPGARLRAIVKIKPASQSARNLCQTLPNSFFEHGPKQQIVFEIKSEIVKIYCEEKEAVSIANLFLNLGFIDFEE